MDTTHQLKMDTQQFLTNIISRIESIVLMIRNHKFSEVSERLVFLAEDIEVLAGTAFYLKEECSALDLNELNEKLFMLMERMEERDYLHVSDLLSYELKTLLEYWSEQLKDA